MLKFRKKLLWPFYQWMMSNALNALLFLFELTVLVVKFFDSLYNVIIDKIKEKENDY